MKNIARRRLAEESARFMAYGLEDEYLHAKERASMMLGVTDQKRLPSNRQIKDCIERLTKAELGPEETKRRLNDMRQIALGLLEILDDFDPFLIGSVLSGKIRASSDIDLHAYSDDSEEIQERLTEHGYEDIDEEFVENLKGKFTHLRWNEGPYPVEITIYSWSMRDTIMMSSVTKLPMKRADISALRNVIARTK